MLALLLSALICWQSWYKMIHNRQRSQRSAEHQVSMSQCWSTWSDTKHICSWSTADALIATGAYLPLQSVPVITDVHEESARDRPAELGTLPEPQWRPDRASMRERTLCCGHLLCTSEFRCESCSVPFPILWKLLNKLHGLMGCFLPYNFKVLIVMLSRICIKLCVYTG